MVMVGTAPWGAGVSSGAAVVIALRGRAPDALGDVARVGSRGASAKRRRGASGNTDKVHASVLARSRRGCASRRRAGSSQQLGAGLASARPRRRAREPRRGGGRRTAESGREETRARWRPPPPREGSPACAAPTSPCASCARSSVTAARAAGALAHAVTLGRVRGGSVGERWRRRWPAENLFGAFYNEVRNANAKVKNLARAGVHTRKIASCPLTASRTAR